MHEPRERTALQAMSDAVLAIAAELSVEAVLQRLVDAARGLAGARYAAIGVPDGDGAFERFITSGMTDELVAEMGPLPRTHGLLGAMLESERPYRTPDIRQDTRFRGWWPSAHPEMRSFLGVPIVARGGVIGAFYLTDKEGAEVFDEADQRLIEMLAAHAAVAIENARLFERSRELSIVEERNRVARELHDSVSQRLFGVVLAVETAAELLDRDPAAARVQLERAQQLAHGSMDELRSLIFELRPAAVADEGLAAALGKHIGVLRRVHDQDIALRVAGSGAARCGGRVAGLPDRPGGGQQRPAPRGRAAHRRRPRRAQRRRRADGGRRRGRLRPRLPGAALPATRADVDGGAGARPRRDADHRLASRRGDPHPARGGRVIRVLIADDHAVVRQGLRTFLELHDDIEVVGEAADGEEAVAAVEPHGARRGARRPRHAAARRHRRDPPHPPRQPGHARARAHELRRRSERACRRCAPVRPATCSRTSSHASSSARSARSTAARRCSPRRWPPGSWSSSAPRSRRCAPDDRLTPREREVLAQLARGLPNKLIALELGVSERTVKTHVSNLLGKLGFTDRTQAAVYAVRHGVVGRSD